MPLGLMLVSCVAVPPGPDYYGGGPAYGASGSEWQGQRWKQDEAHRREMVRRQEEYRHKSAAEKRERYPREEVPQREAYRPGSYPDPYYEIDPRREEPRGAASPPYELSPERRLDPSDPPPSESREREGGEHPTGIPISGQEGMVYNPIGNQGQMIDVRGIPSGTLVKDPYTETLFRVP